MGLSEKPTSIEDYRNSPEFHEELALLKAQELIAELMIRKNVNKAKLARLMGQSKSHVTELLSGSRNLTLKTFGRICFYLGENVDFRCEAFQHSYDRIDVHVSQPKARLESPAFSTMGPEVYRTPKPRFKIIVPLNTIAANKQKT